VERLIRGGHHITGIFHLAGALDDRIIARQDLESLQRVMRPKVDAAWHLHELSSSFELPLSVFTLFSSTSGLFGNRGQANYCAANSCLDALAHHRRALGLPAQSIQWGPWAEQGMAKGVLQRLSRVGMGAFTNDLALRVLGLCLCRWRDAKPVLALMPVDLSVYLSWSAQQDRQRPTNNTAVVFERLVDREAVTERDDGRQGSDGLTLAARWSGLSPSELREEVLSVVSHEARRVLPAAAAGDNDSIATHTPLADLGMDSLSTLDFQAALSDALQVSLPATFLHDYPSINAIISYCIGKFEEAEQQESLQVSQLHPCLLEVNFRAGDDVRPLLFLIHDVSGTMLTLLPLARALSGEFSVYALRAMGLEKGETPLESVEAIAKLYADVIQSVQPEGPYKVCGFSFGALVAYQTCIELRDRRCDIAVCALIDGFIPMEARQLSHSYLTWQLGVIIAQYFRRPAFVGLEELAALGEELDNYIDYINDKAVQAGIYPTYGHDRRKRMLNVQFWLSRALSLYTPPPYSGSVTVFRATKRAAYSCGARTTYVEFLPPIMEAADVRVYQCEGDHYSMMQQPCVRELSEILRNVLNETLTRS